MPVYLTSACLILDKSMIEKKYRRGTEQFRNDYFNHQSKASQEDDELFLIAQMNFDEFDLEKLIRLGFHFDKKKIFSSDFVIHQRYDGYLWHVNWIEDNSFYAWHMNAGNDLKKMAQGFGEIPMNAIEKVFHNGQEPFISLTKNNIDSHPLARLVSTSVNGNTQSQSFL